MGLKVLALYTTSTRVSRTKLESTQLEIEDHSQNILKTMTPFLTFLQRFSMPISRLRAKHAVEVPIELQAGKSV